MRRATDMPRYKITVKEIFVKEATVNANSKREAREIAKSRYQSGKCRADFCEAPQVEIEVEHKKNQSNVR